ncbi:hypothetical protein TURU_057432 [Turdus rufiventris]|nr:hypothetical protein TURU_057432 [Turdus rufiventris]
MGCDELVRGKEGMAHATRPRGRDQKHKQDGAIPATGQESDTLAIDCGGGIVQEGFSLVAGMAEYVPQPPSTWPAGPQPPHTSAICPLEPVDLGISEQQTPPEQPPSSLELGEDEEITSPPDPDVPYPDLAPVVFFCLKQTTSPRSWCIKMVCNPYPF